MKKSDLRSGMAVKIRNGEYGLIVGVEGYLLMQLGNGFMRVSSYGDRLSIGRGKDEYDIVWVGKPIEDAYIARESLYKQETLWEKTPSIEIDIKINGKQAKLSDISEETLNNIRRNG